MADESSFDVVSKIDMQVLDDAINAANKELETRFDFRGSISKFTLDKKESTLTMVSDDEGKLKSVIEILRSKVAKKGIDQKVLDFQKLEVALGQTVRQVVKIVQGIESEKAKKMVADIKNAKIKVTASIQGDELRVKSKSRDLLQETMALLKANDYGVAIQFTNFR